MGALEVSQTARMRAGKSGLHVWRRCIGRSLGDDIEIVLQLLVHPADQRPSRAYIIVLDLYFLILLHVIAVLHRAWSCIVDIVDPLASRNGVSGVIKVIVFFVHGFWHSIAWTWQRKGSNRIEILRR